MHPVCTVPFALAALAGLPFVAAAAAPEAADKTLWMALMSAVIHPAGETESGGGVVSSQKLGPGQYEVVFARPVADCTFSVTPDASSLETLSGLASPRSGNAAGVYVGIVAANGGLVDRRFGLLVFCPK